MGIQFDVITGVHGADLMVGGSQLLSTERVLGAARQAAAGVLIDLMMAVACPVHLRLCRFLLIHNVPYVVHYQVNSHCNNGKRTLSGRL
jgi:hypothetical protein